MVDYLIIGAGYAGLSAAALLAKNKFSTLLLESHSKIGGCASHYKRKDFTFDVGATTFSGIKPNQPLGRLFKELSIEPKLKKVDPGLIAKIDGKEIIRYADKLKWTEAASEYFNSSKQINFWQKIFEIDELAWEFLSHNNSIPPNSLLDYIKLTKPTNLRYAKLLYGIFNGIQKEINKFQLTDKIFTSFLEEQLLITTQNYADNAPLLTSAMGLAYPSETYYPYGGMYKPAELILNSYKNSGGEVKRKRKVIKIRKRKDYYQVETEKGEVFDSKGIISSIPIWNMAELTDGEIQKYYQNYAKYFDFAWGAFTINFAIETKAELNSLYYQIHTDDQIPNCDSRSYFVSFSAKDDYAKAPDGWRTVTISCHTKTEKWLNLTKEEYSRRKSFTAQYILKSLFNNLPQLEGSQIEWELAGSPKTFQHYTQRKNGFVGGIPHSIEKNLLKMPPNQTPFKNFYQIGDTAFPGQGTPGVVLGALSCVERILK